MFPPYLDESGLVQILTPALREDVGHADVTSEATIEAGQSATAQFLVKENGVLAGIKTATTVFEMVDPSLSVHWTSQDGSKVKKGLVVGSVHGPARSLLTAERLALNVIQRMSGIATATSRMVDAAAPFGAGILDTRKTVPGLRLLDKWAVLLGGGVNHRIGLYDRILIKDNHISASGSIAEAIRKARQYRQSVDPSLKIEIETRTLDEVEEVLLTGGVEIVLLDNMVSLSPAGEIDTSTLLQAVRRIGDRFVTEASGNVTLATVAAIAATGVNFISSGALTHSVTALDVSLKIRI